MNIKNYLYQIRKRIPDESLLKIKSMVDEEIERRTLAEGKTGGKRI